MELVYILEILSRAHISACHELAGIGKGDNEPGKCNRGFFWFGLALKQVSTRCYKNRRFLCLRFHVSDLRFDSDTWMKI